MTATPTVDLTLISHALCPYVQRAAIVLDEKQVAFTRRDVDLSDKPAWFLAISPLGRTPVLRVDGESIYESAVICEYLDEIIGPRLHPDDPLARARHRSWIEFASTVLAGIAGFYNAADWAVLDARARELAGRFAQVESVLHPDGPYFAGDSFSLADAAFAPVFRYFDTFETIADFGILDAKPRVAAWRAALAERPSVRRAVTVEYPDLLRRFLRARGSEISRRMKPDGA